MRKKGSVLSKLVTSYIIIVVIPLIGFLVMYSWMVVSIENYELRMNEKIIFYAYEDINGIIKRINSSQLSLATNVRISRVARYKEIGREEDFECYLLQKELSGLLNSNNDIYHIYIYFPQADICVLEGTTMKADEFFARYYGMSKEESAEWKFYLEQTRYAEQKKMLVTEGGVSTDCIDFLQKFPIMEGKTSAICVASVSTDKIFASLIHSNENGEFLVVNRGGKFLFDNVNSEWRIEKIENAIFQKGKEKNDVIITEKTLKFDWKLYSVTDPKKILVKMNVMRKFIIIFLGLYAVISWLLIRILTKYNYKPLQRLLHSICSASNIENDIHTNEYVWIQEAWKNIQENVKKQRGVVLEKFLQRLLKDGVSEKEWEEKIKTYDIHPVGQEYVVLCFKITEYENMFAAGEGGDNERGKMDLAYYIINNIATEIFSQTYLVLSVNMDDTLMVILNYADNEKKDALEDVKEYVVEIKDMIEQHFHFAFLTVLGNEHSSYCGIHESYKQVLEGLEHQLFYQKNAIIEYSKLEKSFGASYYYPLEMEKNLIACIVSGNVIEAQRMIDGLIKQNLEQILGNKVLAQCFMSDLIATIIKAVGKVLPNIDIRENSEVCRYMSRLLISNNIHEMKKCIFLLLEHVCSNINSKSGSDTADKVVAFIEENYADMQLSITSIAAEMNLHPVYLGSLFKEKTGEKLLDYIARYRIEKSKRLMKEYPAVHMEDIGKMVGYDNVRTFARVFKKYEGITPAQYKKGSL